MILHQTSRQPNFTTMKVHDNQTSASKTHLHRPRHRPGTNTGTDHEFFNHSQLCNNSRRQRADSKLFNALKHLDTILIGYQKQIGVDNFIGSRHLTYYGIKAAGDFEEANKWWDRMIGNFFGYLGTTAYKYLDQDRGRISYETATGYASSIKVY